MQNPISPATDIKTPAQRQPVDANRPANAQKSRGIEIVDRDPQQTMDDSMSAFETGDILMERTPADSERMRLDRLPDSKRTKKKS